MNKKRIFFIFVSGLFLVAVVVILKIFVFGKVAQSNAAVRIDSIPRATVFLNDKEVGQTPFSAEKLTAGDYKVKLVPIGNFNNVITWETNVRLSNGVLTYLSREIGTSDEDSSGQILAMEPLASDKSSEMAIVSDPDGASISIDGIDSGKTSTIIKDITPGDHSLLVSSPDYSDSVARVRVVAGFRVNVLLKMRRLFLKKANTVVVPTSELISTVAAGLTKPYVIIGQTPTGFLRVRFGPDILATESSRVYAGEQYPLQEEINSWSRIKLATMSGWVSDQYIQKVK